MDQEKMDLRIQRTYRFLSDALFELLLKRPFEKISVTDICKKAMVHRTTFYKHFEDKYQLLGMMFLEERKKFDEIHIEEGESEQDYYRRIIQQMFEYAVEYKTFFVQSILLTKNDFITQLLRTTISSYLQECHMENTESDKSNPVPISIMSEYYAGGAVAMVLWWLENDMQIPIDQMVNYMLQLIVW